MKREGRTHGRKEGGAEREKKEITFKKMCVTLFLFPFQQEMAPPSLNEDTELKHISS